MSIHAQQQLRQLPAVHRVLADERVRRLNEDEQWSKEQLTVDINRIITQLRQAIVHGDRAIATEEDALTYIVTQLEEYAQPQLERVINATGVILHTNLGRARLPQQALTHMSAIASQYSNLEYDIHAGNRGSRHDHVEALICRLTGAEAAMVVNNNAAAVFLVLREIAHGKDVLVSRGQLIEIGGSFRISEIMAESGARLVEVGTTNKTKRRDYEKHLTDTTALLLKVHTSNFRIVGFTHEVQREELVALARSHRIPVYEDLGSGMLYDLKEQHIGDEPTVREVLQSGVDIVSFSGDKLLGGPQAGIIAGKKEWIDRLKNNQLMRILRVDKVTLAGLEATLKLYANPERAQKEIPTLRDLLQSPDHIRARALQFLHQLQEQNILADWQQEVVADVSEVGGGTLPTLALPTFVLAFSHPSKGVHTLERALRRSRPAVIARVAKERLLLDFRTIDEAHFHTLLEVFIQIIV